MAEFTDPTLRLHPQRESDVASATLRGRTHHLRIPWGDRAQKINQKINQKIAKWGCERPHFAIWRLCGGENAQSGRSDP